MPRSGVEQVGEIDRALTQQVIAEHERNHRLDHRYRAREYAGIVTPLRFELGRLTFGRDKG